MSETMVAFLFMDDVIPLEASQIRTGGIRSLNPTCKTPTMIVCPCLNSGQPFFPSAGVVIFGIPGRFIHS